MAYTVLGLFNNRVDVEEAINKLDKEGYERSDVSIIMRDKSEADNISDDTGADVAGGAVSGATTGAILGGLAGILSVVALPGLGAFFIGGPIAAALGLTGTAAATVSGAATGAVAGGLVGALMGFGLSEEEAEHYETRLKEGSILVAVPVAEADSGIVEKIFTQYDASDIRTVGRNLDEDVEVVRDADVSSSYTYGTKGGRTKRGKR